MKKVDSLALSISFILNLLILFLIPGMSPKEVVGKIKVGLVSLDNKKSTSSSTKKPPATKPPEKQKPVTPPKPVTPVQPSTPAVVTPPRPNLNDIVISQPKISKKGIKVPQPNLQIPQPTPQTQMEETAESVSDNVSSESAPSGYKLGAVDGDITAKWNPNNKDPEYPQSAQNRGLNGRVSLRLTIDAAGNIVRVILEKRSGVPEIDLAIERVAKSWKINLTKDRVSVKGDVILEYDFKLTGN
ncbi:MAG: energy transducer TonB [Fusobacteriaceae bacterium]